MRFTSTIPVLLLAACGDGGGAGADAAPADALVIAQPDAGCDPTAALPFAWAPKDAVSTGTITTTVEGGVTTALIDATAGGTTAYQDNPFLYIDLATGTKVAITDWDSFTSEEWDLALKRMVIRLNGGDSGPAEVETAVVGAATLAEVTTEPPGNQFFRDDWATETCDLIEGPLEEPRTAMGDWYEYDVNTHVLTPFPYVYVIRARDGTLYKLRIDTYYADPANPMRGANFRIEWAPL